MGVSKDSIASIFREYKRGERKHYKSRDQIKDSLLNADWIIDIEL